MEYKSSVSNPMLVGAIQILKAEDTPEHRSLFLSEAVKAQFLAPALISPLPAADEKGLVRLTPENKIQFPLLTAPDTKRYFLAFSDPIELGEWKPGQEYQTVALTFDEYASMLLRKDSPGSGLVVNPCGANLVLSREVVAAVMARRLAARDRKPPAGQ
ncbi:MAG: SseB family protein [Clostridium sp.]|jgi:hypothetical protein|nr:SseB family protein [Clostridium sp.]